MGKLIDIQIEFIESAIVRLKSGLSIEDFLAVAEAMPTGYLDHMSPITAYKTLYNHAKKHNEDQLIDNYFQ